MTTATTRTRSININIRVTEKESRSFKKAAASSGLDQSAWIRMLCRQAAGMVTTTSQAEEKAAPAKKPAHKKSPAVKRRPKKR